VHHASASASVMQMQDAVFIASTMQMQMQSQDAIFIASKKASLLIAFYFSQFFH
jgi:hypothetical protein